MKAGTKITIEIGKTSIKGDVSCTEYSVNGKEPKVCNISPSMYATDQNVMHMILKDVVKSLKDDCRKG